MLYTRYQTAAAEVMQMPFEDAMILLNRLAEETYKEKLWQRWIAGPQNFMSFDEFTREINSQAPAASMQQEEKSVDEIMQKVKFILNDT